MEFRFDAGQELQLQAIEAVVGSEFHLFLPFRGLVNGANLTVEWGFQSLILQVPAIWHNYS